MTRVSCLTILNLVLYCQFQASYGQQNGVPSNCQQAVQNNAGFSQTADPANLNIQMQQSGKQASSSQQSYNLQQLANIPMQTFNVQQPVNFQQQANSPLNFQPVNQAIGLQQVPQAISLQDVQHDVQQTQSNPVNLQHAPVAQPVNPQQSVNVKAAPPTVTFQQQAHPIHSANLQQQAYTVNLQQQQVQTANLQPQAPQQCVNLQNSVVVQPASLQHQTVVHNGNLQQVPQRQASFQQLSQPYVNIQQQSSQIPQPAVIVQPVTPYQQPVTLHEPIVKQVNIQKCTTQDTQNVQQMQIQQIDQQQKQVPCQNIGGYQVVAYQRPCQQPDVAAAVPMSLHLSKVSTNPYPTVIAAVPAALPDSNKIVQRTDNIYLMNPQQYVNSAPYSSQIPALVMNNMQQVISGPNTMPTALPNSNPASTVDFIMSNTNQCAETTDNRSSSLKTSDLGILSILQGQFPVASLLNQPSSSFESALLSSILSSIQSPSSSPQYVLANHPQTTLSPQCNSQNSKFSLKSLLPLLLNLLQEKYSGCGCQCQCCNCDRSQNDDNVHESPKPDVNEEVQEKAEPTEEPTIDNEEEDDLEEEDIPVNPRHRGKSKYQNMISDDSAEVDETQDSSCEIETDDVGIGSGDEEDLSNDSSKL